MKKGIIGKKLGMTQLFDQNSRRGWPLHRYLQEDQ